MPALGLEVTFGSCGSLIYGLGGFHFFPPQYHGHSPMPLQRIGPNKFATLWLATVGQKPRHCARLSVFTASPLRRSMLLPLFGRGRRKMILLYRKEMKKESCFVPNIELDKSWTRGRGACSFLYWCYWCSIASIRSRCAYVVVRGEEGFLSSVLKLHIFMVGIWEIDELGCLIICCLVYQRTSESTILYILNILTIFCCLVYQRSMVFCCSIYSNRGRWQE